MQRLAPARQTARFPQTVSNAWLARRWYYTPRSRRAYSVRQVAPGDRRLLAEFALALNGTAHEGEIPAMRHLTSMIFDRVMHAAPGAYPDAAVGFAALENTAGGDRIIGVAAYATSDTDAADFAVAVAPGFREEEIGRTLLAALIRHARRVGIRALAAQMHWSNRPMRKLATALGFNIEASAPDRALRRVALPLK